MNLSEKGKEIRFWEWREEENWVRKGVGMKGMRWGVEGRTEGESTRKDNWIGGGAGRGVSLGQA